MQIKLISICLWASAVDCERAFSRFKGPALYQEVPAEGGAPQGSDADSVEQGALRLLQVKWASFKHCTWFLSREAPVPGFSRDLLVESRSLKRLKALSQSTADPKDYGYQFYLHQKLVSRTCNWWFFFLKWVNNNYSFLKCSVPKTPNTHSFFFFCFTHF